MSNRERAPPTATVTRAIAEPMERSIPPEIMTRVTPSAAMPTVTLWTAIVRRLNGVRNMPDRRVCHAKNAATATRPRNGPNMVQARVSVRLMRSSPVAIASILNASKEPREPIITERKGRFLRTTGRGSDGSMHASPCGRGQKRQRTHHPPTTQRADALRMVYNEIQRRASHLPLWRARAKPPEEVDDRPEARRGHVLPDLRVTERIVIPGDEISCSNSPDQAGRAARM